MPSATKATVFVTHAAPEDNEFALWISSKLAMAGYRVWVDKRRLRGGQDFWDEIDRVLRTEAIKQVVVFTHQIGKLGVKKELAIGEKVKAQLGDPAFTIPIRADDISFSDAPPEFLRSNILDAYPNWHDCLQELFEALEDSAVPRTATVNAEILQRIVEAREDGRRFIQHQPEDALTNWFPIHPPGRVRYYKLDGLQDQVKTWLSDCRIPCTTSIARLPGTFADPAAFALASSFEQPTSVGYDVPFLDYVTGENLGPYRDRPAASNDVVNLLRQHFDAVAKAQGLLPVEFASGAVGWFFPDDLLPDSNQVAFDAPDGRRIRRRMSGKFRGLRWHVCLVARPRIWPELVYRVHANVVLTEDGHKPLPGERTHQRRRRLTKSWWNDVWRDRLLAAMHALAAGEPGIVMEAGNETFEVETWPLTIQLPVSYEATDPPLPSEEDAEGNIVPTAALDDQTDEFAEDEADPGESSDDDGDPK